MLTDGEDNDSYYTADEAADYAANNGVKVYMIGLGDPAELDFSEMQNVASKTGGLFASVNDPDQLEQLFDGMFNATKASFCISVKFTVNGAPPAPGTEIKGTLYFKVNGRDLEAPFDVVF